MDRSGQTKTLRATLANWFNLRFSPDGQRLALQINEGQNDIWVYEEARDTVTPLTFDRANDLKPIWTPDGRRVTFASGRNNPAMPNLYWQRADGTGDAQRLTESKEPQLPGSWHPSGKFLAFEQRNPETFLDLMILPMQGDESTGWTPGTATVFLGTAASETEPIFSPDGRWLAYVSDESGRPDVYVRPFPGPGGKRKISIASGVFPTWSRTKPELFYSTGNGQIMVAAYTTEGDSFQAEKPRPWGDWRTAGFNALRMFDLHPDGERFALSPSVQTGGAKQDHLTFVFNLFDELRRIAPPTR
jgi:serine/threonine-protein kinase